MKSGLISQDFTCTILVMSPCVSLGADSGPNSIILAGGLQISTTRSRNKHRQVLLKFKLKSYELKLQQDHFHNTHTCILYISRCERINHDVHPGLWILKTQD